jgi:hypothetical protein
MSEERDKHVGAGFQNRGMNDILAQVSFMD